MMSRFLVPPFEPRIHAVRWPLRRGDTLEGICEAFGLSGARYGELVGANLERGLTDEHVAEGGALKLAGLFAGDLLKLPAHWPVPVVGLAGGAINPGEDNALDPVGLAIADVLQHLTLQKNAWLKSQDVPAIFNAVSQWYRQETPSGAPLPTLDTLSSYINSARNWLTTYGVKMSAQDREHLAWSLFPWRVAQPELALFNHKPIAWATVRAWADAHIKPGQVKAKPEPSHSNAEYSWKNQAWVTSPFWKTIPWLLPFSQIPAWAIPWGYGHYARLKATPKTATPEQNAQALILDLASSLGLPAEDAEPPQTYPAGKTAPGGRPPTVHPKAGAKAPAKQKKPGGSGEPAAAAPAPKTPVGWYLVGAGGVVLVLTLGGWALVRSKRGKSLWPISGLQTEAGDEPQRAISAGWCSAATATTTRRFPARTP